MGSRGRSAGIAKLMARFPQDIQRFADQFVELQEKRHMADYNPDSRLKLRDVRASLNNAERAVKRLDNASLADRRIFAAWVGVKGR